MPEDGGEDIWSLLGCLFLESVFSVQSVPYFR